MVMSTDQKLLVQSSFVKVAVIADQAAELFYERLFEVEPSVKVLFAKTDMKEQGRKLMQMIGIAVAGLDRLDDIVPDIQALGKRHVAYGVKKEHFAVVGEVLLWTLEQGLGADFTPSVKEAWATIYNILAQIAVETGYSSPNPGDSVSSEAHKESPSTLPAQMDRLSQRQVLAQLERDNNLVGYDLSGLNLSGVNLIGANLGHCDLSGADLGNANLSGANLTKANLSNTKMPGAKITGANLTAANLSRSDLTQSDLSGAVLTAANLTKAILEGAQLVGTCFICADLSGARMSQANLTGAVLTGANLTKVNLSGAILCGTNLTVANLTDASLEDARLTGVIGLDQQNKLQSR